MATLADITASALTASGGPYVPVPASGVPGQAYVLVPSTYPTANLHIGGGHSIDEIAALLARGEVAAVVVRPSAQQSNSPTDVVYG
jgi:hypothetical protein